MADSSPEKAPDYALEMPFLQLLKNIVDQLAVEWALFLLSLRVGVTDLS